MVAPGVIQEVEAAAPEVEVAVGEKAAAAESAASKLSAEAQRGIDSLLQRIAERRLASIAAGTSILVKNVAYHPSGQVKSMTYGDSQSTATTVTFDDRARAKNVSAGAGSTVTGLAYAYDGVDNVTSFGNDAVRGSSRTMTYDKLDRLLTTTAPSLWGTAVYDYDALGNRILKSVGSYTSSYTYDSSNRLASATINTDVIAPMTFTWDAPGRLASSSDGTTYFYDGRGHRIEKVGPSQTTLYHYDPAGRVLAESTLPLGTKLRDFVYLGNKLIVVDGCVDGAPSSCTSTRQWYHTDALGSVVARTDSSGVVTARFDYEPWGEQYTVPAAQGDRQYNGRVYDPGTGFHDYGARMYWPAIGRFISADSYHGDIVNPASLNRYSYAHDNPFKYVDPSGHDAIPVVFPDYKISTPVGRIGGLGHAGIVLVNANNGATRYYEYGRYDTEGKGLVQRADVPDVVMGKDGRPTPESMSKLLSAVSKKAGHGTRVEGAYVKSDSYEKMVKYAEGRKAANADPNRKPYGITGNNCGTFMKDTLEAGGVDTPWMIDPRPNSYIKELQSDFPRVQQGGAK